MANNANLQDNITPYSRELYDKSEKLTSPDDILKVIEFLEQALADSPDSRIILIKLAASYRQSGSIGKAIKLLEGVAEKFGSDTEIQHELANSYAERKWNKKAKQKYMECLEKDNIYPELIQDFAESCLDLCEYEFLSQTLPQLLEKCSEPFDTNLAAMCMAMIYSMINECADKQINCGFSKDFLKEYSVNSKTDISEEFYIKTISYLSETPNDSSILPLFSHILSIIKEINPSVSKNFEFRKAVTDFEISIILFSSDVTPLTILAMRMSRYTFRSLEENIDELNYLIFDAKLSVIDAINKKYLSNGSVHTFREKYPNLWKLISEFTEGAFGAADLREYSKGFIYKSMSTATPEFLSLLKKNLPPESYEKLVKYGNSQSSTQKSSRIKQANKQSAVTVRSVKTPPNSACPCGSGKKYKKCCGLK